MGIPGPLNPIVQLPASSQWIATVAIMVAVLAAFMFGVCVASKPYMDRYPVETNWWVDNQQVHYPGVIISTATVNTSCRQQGNIRPPVGDNITQIQWIGGLDAGFVGNLKIEYNETSLVTPIPLVGDCVYVYDAPANITVYGQDTTSGAWVQLGKRE